MLDEFFGIHEDAAFAGSDLCINLTFTGLPFGRPEPRLICADRFEASQDHPVIGDFKTHIIAFINEQGLAHRSGKCDLPLRPKDASCHDSYFPTFLHDNQSCEGRPVPYVGIMANTAKTTKTSAKSNEGSFTVPGLALTDGHKIAEVLQGRLHALNDLALTLKHVHWNVVGPHFIAVHEMIDPQVLEVRAMIDDTAERIATLGVSPVGTPGALVAARAWDDYSLGRATTDQHLGALDEVYANVIGSHRKALAIVAKLDPITEDMLIGHLTQLELFHWFIRAHLESTGGDLSTGGASTEKGAAAKAARAAKK